MRTAGLNAFAFQNGFWTVRHRKLRERLADCNEWYEFSGHCQAWELLEGAGNVDDHWIGDPVEPYAAATIRRLEPNGSWSIWWIDSRRNDLDLPMSGTFVDGIGLFYGKDEFRASAIDVRFTWSRLETNPRWEQAFSADGGISWETNWTMDFHRETRDD